MSLWSGTAVSSSGSHSEHLIPGVGCVDPGEAEPGGRSLGMLFSGEVKPLPLRPGVSTAKLLQDNRAGFDFQPCPLPLALTI